MNREEIFDILSELLANEAEVMPKVDEQDGFLEVSMLDPLTDETSFYRYWIRDQEKILVEKHIDGNVTAVTEKTFREIVWKSCRLKRVCTYYKNQYEDWKRDNNDIPYIETKINDESDGSPKRSFAFIRDFWKEELTEEEDENRNLRLLLAEYGFGKSSYCQGIRSLAVREIETPFLKENAAFPFVFDLNRFRSGDFDKFIESELFASYRVSMVYPVFEKLCQNGIFMVVLDAWDQIHSAQQVRRVKQDLNQMSPLWKKKGRALITCRRSFYQQQLKIKGNLPQNVGLYRLNGFGKESAVDYLNQKNEERIRDRKEPLMPDASVWIGERWELNKDLFEKPLNLRLLVRHFSTITAWEIDLRSQQIKNYQFLKIIFDEWKERNHVGEAAFLKELVSQTLSSGLNRSVSLTQFLKSFAEEKRETIIRALSDFDFIRVDKKNEQIEFYLAAYQEFIWAHFALQELKAEPAVFDFEHSLVRKYLLIREVREWICTALGEDKSDCLRKQIDYVKYRSKEEVGFQGANALTLLCDLNRISYYKKQLEDLKEDLWRRPLGGTDFRGMNLPDADFHGSDLSGADFSYTKLDRANFRGTDLAQTVWDEHGEMRKCAFLNQNNTLCVIAGTCNGGVLTYRIKDRDHEVLNLQNDVINDLAGDRGGIYTASSDGWVGYLDKNGNLRNVYIAQGGLQSIAHTNRESCVYVGAENQEIYRYNWNTGSRQKIEVSEALGNGEDRISDIHYYSNSAGEDYIAYTLKDKQLLVLLKLTGVQEGRVVAKGILRTEGRRFGDICFADEMLIYSVVGRGVYGIPVPEMLYDIPEEELISDEYGLLSLPDANKFFIGWANEKKELMIAARSVRSGQYKIHAVDLASEKRRSEEIDLYWICNRMNYCGYAEKMKGFSVSDDGEYIAFSGEVLAVFQKQGSYYELSGEPIEAKISCKDADFSNSMGLNGFQVSFLRKRGAVIKGEESE